MGQAKRPNSVNQIYYNLIDNLNTDDWCIDIKDCRKLVRFLNEILDKHGLKVRNGQIYSGKSNVLQFIFLPVSFTKKICYGVEEISEVEIIFLSGLDESAQEIHPYIIENIPQPVKIGLNDNALIEFEETMRLFITSLYITAHSVKYSKVLGEKYSKRYGLKSAEDRGKKIAQAATKYIFQPPVFKAILLDYYDAIKEVVPIKKFTYDAGWKMINDKWTIFPTNQIAQIDENESYFLFGFENSFEKCSFEIFNNELTNCQLILLCTTLFTIIKKFYHNSEIPCNFLIYITPDDDNLAYLETLMWTNLYCNHSPKCFEEQFEKKAMSFLFADTSKIPMYQQAVCPMIIAKIPHALPHIPSESVKLKPKEKRINKKLVMPKSLEKLLLKHTPIIIRPSDSQFMYECQNCISIPFTIPENFSNIEYRQQMNERKIQIAYMYQYYVDNITDLLNNEQFAKLQDKLLKKNSQLFQTDEDLIKSKYYTMLLTAFDLLIESMKHSTHGRDVDMTSHRDQLVTLFKCQLNMEPRSVAEYGRLFAEFVAEKERSGHILALGVHECEGTLGWCDNKNMIYLKYDEYFPSFVCFCKQKSIIIKFHQRKFQKEYLAPLGLLIPQFEAKEDQYLRYDIKKVIVQNKDPIKVIKFTKQKLCELR